MHYMPGSGSGSTSGTLPARLDVPQYRVKLSSEGV